MRRSARVAASVLLAVLVGVPLTAAAAVPPAAVLPVVKAGNPLDPSDAYNLNQYRLSMLPPTMDDLRRYNPNATDAELQSSIDMATDRLDEQRQRASIARYGKTTSIPLNTTDAQLQQEIAAQKAGFRFPFSKAAGVARTAGGVAAAVTGYEMGTAIGDGALTMFGIDPQDSVCNSSFSVLGPLIGVGDCGDYLKQLQQSANADAPGGITSDPVDDGAGNVWEFAGTAAAPDGGTGWLFKLDSNGSNSFVNPVLWMRDPTGATRTYGTTVFKCGTGSGFQQYCPLMFSTDLPGNDGAGWTVLGVCSGSGSCDNSVHTLSTDPERHLECDTLGSDGVTYPKTGPAFHETDDHIPEPVCATLPDGVTPKHVTVSETGGPAARTIYDGDQDPWAAEVAQKFPECVTGLCTLELIQKSSGKSCFDGASCDGWFDDPSKTDDYSCEYDGTVVTLDHCDRYRQTFAKDAITSGAPYSAPDGTFRLKPTTKSQAGTALAGAPTFDSCMSSAGTSDVFTTIFNPVRCAFVWAFVPAPLALQQQAANLSDQVMSTDIGKWLIALPNFFARLSVAGCQGPGVTIGPPLQPVAKTYYPFDACTGWQATAASWTFLGSSAVLLFAGLASVLSSVSSVFGFAGFGKGQGGGDES